MTAISIIFITLVSLNFLHNSFGQFAPISGATSIFNDCNTCQYSLRYLNFRERRYCCRVGFLRCCAISLNHPFFPEDRPDFPIVDLNNGPRPGSSRPYGSSPMNGHTYGNGYSNHGNYGPVSPGFSGPQLLPPPPPSPIGSYQHGQAGSSNQAFPGLGGQGQNFGNMAGSRPIEGYPEVRPQSNNGQPRPPMSPYRPSRGPMGHHLGQASPNGPYPLGSAFQGNPTATMANNSGQNQSSSLFPLNFNGRSGSSNQSISNNSESQGSQGVNEGYSKSEEGGGQPDRLGGSDVIFEDNEAFILDRSKKIKPTTSLQQDSTTTPTSSL